ncbi:hypothetical protein FB45DRAFT_895162 [Roridomyces roridus]|uniref:FAD/NAD(P)-binding domain-containing protein n=1 Tax=Roridomyces roridus TaxID=1738132 RepID=A0AAD7CGR3_9AGAR|nr:hypothetical protein FB45DRAFT_895162 [Roridomyces roridus]
MALADPTIHVPNLPTLENLGVTSVPDDLDVASIAAEWMASFTACAERGDAEGVAALFIPESHWRDMLALTWDFRTFNGLPAIRQFLTDRLASAKLSDIRVKEGLTGLQRPYPDIAWIQIGFDFATQGNVGQASGIVRIVPQSSGPWKAHHIYTNLEDLTGFPEKLGPRRNFAPNHGKWVSEREKSVAFENENPTVLVIGGGHSGLDMAARLKCLDVRTLVVERNPRIGDNWRNRYEALCLHDPVWYDHMPYLPFPPTWPVFTPAMKLGDWLESYAKAMELDVWTSSVVRTARKNDSGTWDVVVERQGKERTFTVKHVVFALGLGANEGKLPSYPGMDRFKGETLHSTQHKRASDHLGKKVVIIGACTSAHDIAADYYEHGVDVTIFQRSSTYVMSTKHGARRLLSPVYWEGGPPTDLADRLAASFPLFMSIELKRREARLIAEDDKEVLDGLRRRGFRLDMGQMDAGIAISLGSRGGGYYLDVGASQMIVDGKIKLKNDSQIAEFTETGLKFENGSELPADVIVFATGLGDPRVGIRRVCGDVVADQCKPLWGLNEEGEIHGIYRDVGIPGLWYMTGNLALSRFHSKHVALQIKAMEEGQFGERYSLQ